MTMTITISKLRDNYSRLSRALLDVSQRFSRSPDPKARVYGSELMRLIEDTRTDRELTEYVLIDKSEFATPELVTVLKMLGVTPERIKSLAINDPVFYSLLLKHNFHIDDESIVNDDTMGHILKVILFNDYEGSLND